MAVKAGYKQTEVGVIPEDWEVKSLNEVASFTNGKAHEHCIDEFGDFIVVNSKFVSTQGSVAKNSNQAICPLNKGDITMVMSDIPNGKALAKCFTVPVDNKYTLNQRICAIRAITIDNDFLAILLNRNKYYLSFDSGSGQTNLRKSDVLECPLSLPSTLAEQTAIATALSDADALIEALEQLIHKKRNIKQGAMQELLTGKKRLPGFEVKKGYKQTEVGTIPSDWSCMQLPSLMIPDASSIKIGPFGSALKKELLTKDGFKVYGQENVYDKNMEIGDRFINVDHFRKLRSCEIKQGDFLISMMGTVGKCMIVPPGIQEGIMDSHLLRLRLDFKKLNTSFLMHMFETRIVFDQVKQLSVGGIMEGLSSKIIKRIQLPTPSIDEQSAISIVLSDMDAEIAALEEKLKKARAVKQGMMQELLTGRVRLV